MFDPKPENPSMLFGTNPLIWDLSTSLRLLGQQEPINVDELNLQEFVRLLLFVSKYASEYAVKNCIQTSLQAMSYGTLNNFVQKTIQSVKTTESPAVKNKPTENTINEKVLNLSLTNTSFNAHAFHFLRNPKTICTGSVDPKFIIIVQTRPENYRRRMLIRKTLGHPKMFLLTRAVVIFAMGKKNDINLMSSVGVEAETHNDILQEDFVDAYQNLTYKSIMCLKWIPQYCNNTKFFIKMDDDVFIDIPRFIEKWKIEEPNIGTFTLPCNLRKHDVPERNSKSKYFLSKQEYPEEKFPTFCPGPLYIMTTDLCQPLFEASKITKPLKLEDVYITGVLAKTIGAKYYQLNRLFGNVIIHGLDSHNLEQRWKQILPFN